MSAVVSSLQIAGSVSVRILPFPKVEVRLSELDNFIAKCGGPSVLQNLTTTDVCNQYLKPMTLATGKSYCEQLKDEGDSNVTTAKVFISHAWANKFLDVVDTIKYRFRNDLSDVVIWFDLFSNNQHSAPNLDFDWWSTTFRSAIQQLGHVIVILAPWSEPTPLKRAG